MPSRSIHAVIMSRISFFNHRPTFPVLFGPLYVLFGKMSIQVFPNILIRLFFCFRAFLLLNCMSSLHIWGTEFYIYSFFIHASVMDNLNCVHVLLMCLISSVQLLSHVQHFVTPWTTACQASQSITNSQSPPKLMSIDSVMPSSHLILCRPLLLLPPIPPSIRVFSNESTLLIRWPKYWSFSFIVSFQWTPRIDLL